MTRTIVALYDDLHQAQRAVKDLVDKGFDREKISLVASDARGEYSEHMERGDQGDDMMADAGKGAGIGAVLGGLAGLVVGLGALAIPGIGPIVAAGPIAAALGGAGIGAAAGGLVGVLTNLGVPEDEAKYYADGVREGGTLITAQIPDNRVEEAVRILNQYNPRDINRREGVVGHGTGHVTAPDTMRPSTPDRERESHKTGEHGTLPVVEEDMQVGKRDVEKGRVRVDRTVSEREVEEDVHLRDENVHVDRRQVDRPVSDRDRDAFKEESFEISEHTEEPMVRKEARVTEEVDIHKDVDERSEKIRGTVRRSDVDVQRTGGSDFDEFEPIMRSHFQATYSHSEHNFEDYYPAYQYGYELREHDHFRGRRWNDIERDVRSDWEKHYPNHNWNDYREAVQQGYTIANQPRR